VATVENVREIVLEASDVILTGVEKMIKASHDSLRSRIDGVEEKLSNHIAKVEVRLDKVED